MSWVRVPSSPITWVVALPVSGSDSIAFFDKFRVDRMWVVVVEPSAGFGPQQLHTGNRGILKLEYADFWEERSLCLPTLRSGHLPGLATYQSLIDMVKLLRVYGGCLGVERR